ncbi:MAG: hypothetical protein HXY50_01690 [Ignavibacteriaceae bacterium]|nr:hypothetical protein [Ignavibacteriaceae bacterium]
MNRIAEQYVKLVLTIGNYDSDYVDAYYGPEEWKPKLDTPSANDSTVIQSLYDEAGKLLDSLENLSQEQADEILTLRYKFLYKQILAARTKVFMLAGGKLNFDEEAKAFYDVEVPSHDSLYFQSIVNKISKLLPGKGSVAERWQEYKKQFIIPSEKLDEVFQTAINECRKRTLQYIKLPSKESFKVEYVKDKPWGGYNWYKGNSFSVIQVNTDLPSYIDRAVDLAAHEGYPGHHVLNVQLEKLYRERNWVEFCIYPLYSPQSLIAEGTANYGIDVAFPGDSQTEFEKEILFPLAGLDPSKADGYYMISKLIKQLSYSSIEAARYYLDDKWTKEQTIKWLQDYNLASKERAEQNLKFFEKYRCYIINYSLGQDIVKNYVEKNGGTEENVDLRWKIFEKLISTPQTPSVLIIK